ncbi:MAG: hypothetical protein ACK4TI_03890 [Nitrososphaerales archaeon]
MNIDTGPDEDLLTKELNLGFVYSNYAPTPSLTLKSLGEIPTPEPDRFVGKCGRLEQPSYRIALSSIVARVLLLGTTIFFLKHLSTLATCCSMVY